MRTATRIMTTLCFTAILGMAPHVASAQVLTGPRLGLTNLVQPHSADRRGPHVVSMNHSSRNWRTGAIIGGLVGLALASLYNSVVSDSEHQSLRALEFTFGGAVLGGLITS